MNEKKRPPGAGGGSMIRGSLISLGVRLLDIPSRYGFHLLIAAWLGVVETGVFYIVFSTMVTLAGFGRLGIDQALTRQIAMDLASGHVERVRPAIRHALLLVLSASTTVSILLAAGAFAFANVVLKKPELALPLVLSALSPIPQNLGAVIAGALSGLQRVGYSQMIYSWLWPAIFCIAAVPMGVTGQLNVADTLVLMAVSFALTALAGMFFLKRFLQKIPPASTPPSGPSRLIKPGFSLFTLELTKLLTTSAPAMFLGIVASTHETGLFALSWRVALVVNLLITGVTGMAVPKFASLYAQKDMVGLDKSAAQAVGLVICLALPVASVMLLFPERLLAFFGTSYGQGATALRVLALGQIAAVCFTAMPEMLGMTSHTSVLYRINLLSVAVLLVGLAVLAPSGGSVGAAVATSLSIAVNGATAAWAAHKLLHVFPLLTLWRWVCERWTPRVGRQDDNH